MYPEGEDAVELGGLQLSPYPFTFQEGQFDLTLAFAERSGAFRAILKYNTDLFEEATVRKFSTDYVNLVSAVTSDPEVALSSMHVVKG